jgi:hypothetical protein
MSNDTNAQLRHDIRAMLGNYMMQHLKDYTGGVEHLQIYLRQADVIMGMVDDIISTTKLKEGAKKDD